MDWKQFIKALFSLAEPYLAKRGDLLHTQVAHEYALLLMEKEGGDRRIVEPAIILHDVGWSQVKADEMKGAYGLRAAGERAAVINRVHEVEGMRIAGELLQKLDYSPLLIGKIVQIIGRHDSGKEPDSIEEKLVKDSDKLWRFSKVGYYNEMKRQELTHEQRYKFLAANIDKWFFTDVARELAERELRIRAKEMPKRSLAP